MPYICSQKHIIVFFMHRFYLISLSLLLLCLSWSAPAMAAVNRQQAMLNAKNLVVTTTKGTTYYYLVTTNDPQRLTLADGNIEICGDVFDIADIQGISYRSLARQLLHEDSTTFNTKMPLDHGLLGLRRSLVVGKWNSLVLPVALTTEQILDAFGEDTEVAQPRGVSEEDATVVELETIEMKPGATIMKEFYHYLVRPTREPDVTSDNSLVFVAGTSRVYGPIYLIPNVTRAKSVGIHTQTFYDKDGQATVRFRGTYKKQNISKGTYMLNDEGLMVQNEETTEVKAFTSWVEDINPGEKPLTFYVDGESIDPTAIADLRLPEPKDATADDGIYDLSGRRVGTLPADRSRLKPGMYVIQGRKVIVK